MHISKLRNAGKLIFGRGKLTWGNFILEMRGNHAYSVTFNFEHVILILKFFALMNFVTDIAEYFAFNIFRLLH